MTDTVEDTTPSVPEPEPEPEAETLAKEYPKPDEEAHRAAIQNIQDEIAAHKREQEELNNRISSKDLVRKDHRENQGGIRDELKGIHQQRQALIDRKKGERAKLSSIQRVQLPKRKDQPRMSVEEVEDRIRGLEYKHSTESLTLKEEKTLVQEVKELKKSIDGLKAHQKKITQMKADKASSEERRTVLIDSMKKYDAQIDALRADETQVRAKLDALVSKEKKDVGNMPELIKGRAEKRNVINECYNRLRTLKSEFKTELDKWYNNDRQVREQGKAERQAKYEQRKKDEIAENKAWEEERAKEQKELGPVDPFEHEKSVCDNLLVYLATFQARDVKKAEVKEFEHTGKVIGKGAKNRFVEEDEWGALASHAKWGKKKGKKKQRGRAEAKAAKKTAVQRLNIPFHKLGAFHELEIEAPQTVAEIADLITAIEGKKASYDDLAAAGKTGKKPRKVKVVDLKISGKGEKLISLTIRAL